MEDIIIIGGGVIGAFVARYLSAYEANILILEKETDVCDATSMANSAIGHSGYDPLPGTKKAYFNVAGNRMYPTVCKELDVHFNQCGSLTIATEEGQLEILKSLQERAKQNGVEAILLSQEELRKAEPNISPNAIAALLCPSAGVVNPFALTVHAFENAIDNGARIELSCEVLGIKKIEEGYEVHTSKGDYKARCLINCAGVYADKIAAMIEEISWSIRPRKGMYYVLDHYAPGLVNHTLFPLPSEKGKGVLVTMTTSGNYLVGPSSEWVDDKDDLSTDPSTLSKVKEMAMSLVPSIPFREQIRVFAGLRATPSTHDFIIEPSKTYDTFINVAGIESPGLASSPAIGLYVADMVAPILNLKKKASWNPFVRPRLHPMEMDLEERNKLIESNPDYGRIICNCERISLGEIEDELSRCLPPRTIKALKKRTRAGFGKCQGGFCQPNVLLLLAKHFNVSPLEVLYDKEGSTILQEVSK